MDATLGSMDANLDSMDATLGSIDAIHDAHAFMDGNMVFWSIRCCGFKYRW